MNGRTNFRTITEAIDFHLDRNEERIAFEVNNKEVVTYRQLAEEIKKFRNFALETNIQSDTRIAIFTKDIMCHVILELSIYEYCTKCMIKEDVERPQLEFMMDLQKVEYIITDQLYGNAYELAVEKNIGIIQYENKYDQELGLSYKVVEKSLIEHDKPVYSGRIGRIATTSGTTSVPKVVPTLYESKNLAFEMDTTYYRLNENGNTIAYKKPYLNLLATSLYAGCMLYVVDGFRHNEVIELVNTKEIYWL